MAHATALKPLKDLRQADLPSALVQGLPTFDRAYSRALSRIKNQYTTPQSGRFQGLFKALAMKDGPRRDEALDRVYGSAEIRKTAMTDQSGIQGGYLAPLEYTTELMLSLAEASFIWPRARIIPMHSMAMQCPMLDATTVQVAGTAPFWGGMKWTWNPSQGGSLTETEPAFRNGTLQAEDLIGYAVLSNQFVNDIGPEGEEALVRVFGEAAAYQAEYAFLQGTGTANLQPLGMLNAPCAIAVNRASGNHVAQADLIGMAAHLLPASWATSVWACSPSVIPDLFKVTGFIPNQNFEPIAGMSGLAGSLYCRPLFVTDKLPPLGTAGDLLFFDPALYIIGDRQQPLVEASSAPLFQKNQTVFRVWLRCAGQPMLNDKVTTIDASTTVSSVVYLN